MTQAEAQQRNEKAQALRVFKVNDTFYVESSEGKICYGITNDERGITCTCGDYAKGSKNDPTFRCKHIIAALQCTGNDLVSTEYLSRKKPTLDERFIIKVKEKDFALYAGLLDLAHQMDLVELKAHPVQYPTKENGMEAICTAYAKTYSGKVFEDVGDANPMNTDRTIAKHIIRMASTRAKARVLRDLTNIGMTCLEELGDLDDIVTEQGNRKGKVIPIKEDPRPAQPATPAPAAQTAPASVPTPTPAPPSSVPQTTPSPKISDAQKRAVLNLCRRRGLSEEDLNRRVQEQYKVSIDDLSREDASAFIKTLQQAA